MINIQEEYTIKLINSYPKSLSKEINDFNEIEEIEIYGTIKYKLVFPPVDRNGGSPEIYLSHYIVLLDKSLTISKNGKLLCFDKMIIFSKIPHITAIIRDSYFSKGNNGFYKITGKLLLYDDSHITINAINIEFIK